MKVGDLVCFYEASGPGFNNDFTIAKTGLVLEIINWVYATDIKVLWQDGSRMLYSPDELVVIGSTLMLLMVRAGVGVGKDMIP